ncbi:MAG: YdcF family protein [Prevotella sp.]|nr:YdcF family protein [Prevotella sp.]
MDTAEKGALARTCLILIALLSAAGFAVFLAPVTAGIVNIGNAAGMSVCAAVFFLAVFWNRFFRFMSGHRAVRVIFIAAVTAAALLAVLAAVISAFMVSAAHRPPNGDTTVIVLGCKVKGEEPSLMLRQRIMAAYGFLEKNPSAVCIVSGGQGADELISEAESMKRVLVEQGISEDRIIMEDRSTGTDENIRFSLEKMNEYGLDGSVTVVTNDFHQLRAKLIADKYGLESYAVSARTSLWLLPTYWLREWFGVCYQVLLGQ